MRVMFFHGMEGSPTGPKVRTLRKKYPNLEVPDFQGMSYGDRLTRAKEQLTNSVSDEPVFLIGSSMGGALAIDLANQYPDRIMGYLLLAPAIACVFHPVHNVPYNTSMILGELDDPGFNQRAREFGQKFGVQTVIVPDGHRLEESLDLVLDRAIEGIEKVEADIFWANAG